VGGASSRLVPVEGPWASVLEALADERRGYLFRPGATVRDTKNLVGEIAASLVGDPDDVALSSGRGRSTFIGAHLLNDTPLRELCAVAGLSNVESLLRYARYERCAPDKGRTTRARDHDDPSRDRERGGHVLPRARRTLGRRAVARG